MKNSKFIKLLSIVLSLVLVASAIPFSGFSAVAAEGFLTIQYLKDGVVQPNVELKLDIDGSSADYITENTNELGAFETEVTWEELSETFVIYIDGNRKEITKETEKKEYLIINTDEVSWANGLMPVESITVTADKTALIKNEGFSATATVKGTAVSYQWYKNGSEINGATSRVFEISDVKLSDAGKYTCRVTDAQDNTRTSDEIQVTVSEKEANGTFKAYANGEEITGSIDRTQVSEIELKITDLPTDANVTEIKYYVNENCVESGTAKLSYTYALTSDVEYTFKAVVSFDKYYASKTFNIAKIDALMQAQGKIEIKVDETAVYDSSTGEYAVTYSSSPKVKFDVTVEGGSGTGEYSLEIIEEKNSDGNAVSFNGSVVSLDKQSDGVWTVTAKNAGSFKLRATKNGDANYNSADAVEASFRVNRAKADGFAFVTPAPEAIIYNTNNNEFTNTVVEGYDEVTYSIESGSDVATVDEKTGKVTVLKAGTVKVKATLAESGNYEGATATYDLIINKADQTIAFEEKADKVFYGQEYIRTAAPVAVEGAADGFGYNSSEDAKIVYSVVLAEGEEAVATVKEDGKLEYISGKTGAVTVKAVLAENDCYNEAQATYTVNVEEYSVENGYKLKGTKVGDSEWYSSDITITPAEGHQISKTGNADNTNVWENSIVINNEGSENGLKIYLRNTETGAISKGYAIPSEDLLLDKSKPTGLEIEYKTERWFYNIIENVTFGYYNSRIVFCLRASDSNSGIDRFEWKLVNYDVEDTTNLSGEGVPVEKNNDKYVSENIALGDENDLKELKGRISFVAYDKAGNKNDFTDEYVIVVDATNPEVSIKTDSAPVITVNGAYPYEAADDTSIDPVEIYSSAIEVTLSVIEKNFFAENATVNVNGEAEDVEWTVEGDNHLATLKLKDDGDYTVELIYNEIFGKDETDKKIVTYSATKTLVVDTAVPEVSISLSEPVDEVEAKKYYNAPVTATITVKEAKFNPANLTISAVDTFTGMSAENVNLLNSPDNWVNTEGTDEYTKTVTFDAADGDYAFTADFKDLAGNSAEKTESGVFVIDTTASELNIATATAPVCTVENAYPYNAVAADAENAIDVFGEAVTVNFTIVEKNFFADGAVVTVNGEAKAVEWTSAGNEHTATVTLDSTGDYTIGLSYTDIFGNEVNAADLIAVDNTKSEISISLSEAEYEANSKKYYDSPVTATIKVEEFKFNPSNIVISDVDAFKGMSAENAEYLKDSANWKYDETDGVYVSNVEFDSTGADGDYSFVVDYSDIAGNAADQAKSEIFVIDTTASELNIATATAPVCTVENAYPYNAVAADAENAIDVFGEAVTVNFTIVEKNFFADGAVVTVNGEAKAVEWTSAGDEHTATLTLTDSNDYDVKLTYTDIFGVEAEKTVYEATDLIAVDNDNPVVNVALSEAKKIAGEKSYYNSDVLAKITVTDARFRPAELVVSDISGYLGISEENKDYLSDSSNWKLDAESGSYTASIVIMAENADGNYKFAVDHKDLTGKAATQAVSDIFVIDTVKPVISVNYGEAKILNSKNEVVTSITDNNVTVFDNKNIVISVEITDVNFDPENVALNITKDSKAISSDFDGEWLSEGDIHKNTVTLKEEGIYSVSISSTDNALNKSDDYKSPKIVYSQTVPSITFEISPENENLYYSTENVSLTIKVFDDYFNPDNFAIDNLAEISKDIDGNLIERTEADTIPDFRNISAWAEGTNAEGKVYHSVTLVLGTEARYKIDASYKNATDTRSEGTYSFVLDRTEPVYTIEYSQNDVYRTVLDVITFRLFNPEVKVTVTAEDNISGVDEMDIKYNNVLTPAIDYNSDEFNPTEHIDAPAGDDAKTLKYEWVVSAEQAKVQAKGIVSVCVTDNSGNSTGEIADSANEIAIDNVASTVSSSITEDLQFANDGVVITVKETNFDPSYKIDNEYVFNLEINARDIDGNVIDSESYNEKKNAIIESFHNFENWSTDNAEHSITLKGFEDGIYTLKISGKDLAGNEIAPYTTKEFICDTAKPDADKIKISYSTPYNDETIGEVKYNYYNDFVDITFTAEDPISGVDRFVWSYMRMSDADEANVEEKIGVAKVQAMGTTATATITLSAEEAKQYRGNISVQAIDRIGNGSDTVTDSKNAIVVDSIAPVITCDVECMGEGEEINRVEETAHTVILTVEDENFDPTAVLPGTDPEDKNYLFNIDVFAVDISKRTLDPEAYQMVLGDFRNPAKWSSYNEASGKLEGTTHTIKLTGFDDGIYSFTFSGKDLVGNEAESYKTKYFVRDGSKPYDVIISYSTPKLSKLISAVTFNYYNAPVEVTFTATDSTSGIRSFEWSYAKESGASNTNVASKNGIIEINKPLILDETGSTETVSMKLPAGSIEQYRGNISVRAIDRVGNISDTFTDKKTVIVVDTIAPTREVEFSEAKNSSGSFDDGGKLYYDSTATATIRITEANFYPEDLDLKVNDEPFKVSNWTRSGDVWTGIIEFSEDGHYIISMNYADRSTNKMAEYKSGEIIVDKQAPAIEVTYSPDKPVYTSGERKFYDEDQVATIVITEHNFDPAGVAVELKSTDINGSDVAADDIASQLSSASAWSSDGDVHTAKVTYSKDANYTFSIKCTDAALNESEEFTPHQFTVDKTAPKNLSVKFSESVVDAVIENITFGFYNAPVTVTVSADDSISGIRAFTYSYSDPTSENSGVKTETINVAASTGSGASTKFKVPAEAVQFKGNIKVNATDNAGNKSSDYTDDRVIVVDTVAPVGNIELSAPVSTGNGLSYYSNNVTATLTIEEENFYGEDVVVYVDGNSTETSGWTNNGNAWTSTVSVSSDGQHRISMAYADKSGNAMAEVQSNQFVIDRTKPVIAVSGIQMNSANRGETVGFTVRASDTNFVASGFEAVLTASVRAEDGTISTETIELPAGASTGNGYSVNVENLEKDGIYTLTCKATDICGNVTDSITVVDSNNAQTNSLKFSVNRSGSTFTLDEGSKNISSNYYVQAVGNNIVITEVNVDTIKESTVMLNGKALTEGVDYTVQNTGGDGEWNTKVYTINSSLFAEEGEYSVVINSKDSTDTEFYSDIKGAKVSFVVDATAPDITISGLESGGSYQNDKQEISLIPSDDGGSIVSLRVEITGADGNVTVPVDASGADLEKLLSEADGIVSFFIEEGVRQNVRIICVDAAGNEVNEEFKNISVSPNRLVLLWASTGFRVGLGIAGLAAVGLIIFIVLKKKKKKEN